MAKRSVWLSVFIVLQVVAFTCLLLALISPSWQYVYLEDGRTEHHHGLWLDCKRDYSNEYGRPRDYYETLYRRDKLQGPFDQLWLPPLLCVYKFDYWLDDEDWYEHGYDENRLQGDAYQHLFIGWKIAALTAITFATVCSLTAVVMLFCAYCHRILVCVTAVLVSLALITCLVGNVVFYLFANYQDNNIIKEEDGIYEQYFGWSFYMSLTANFFLFLSSIFGCFATSATLGKKKAQLVKIELEEDDKQLLTEMGSVQPSFKRSKSAIYKIDSKELRKWEKEQLRIIQKNAFKRANSMPNMKKIPSKSSSQFLASTSDLSKAITEPPTKVTFFEPQPQPEDDVVYEYVEANTISLISDRTYNSKNPPPVPVRPPTQTNIPVYDSVFERANENDDYLKPRSCASTPIGISVTKPQPLIIPLRSLLSRHEIENRFESESLNLKVPLPSFPPPKPPSTELPIAPPKPALRSSLRQSHSRVPSSDPTQVQINTFQQRDESGRIRSLTNLALTDTNAEPFSLFPGSRSPTEMASSIYSTQPGLKETSFGRPYQSSENDRSLGSSTYRPTHVPYDIDDDRSTVSTSISGGSTTFKAVSQKEFTLV